MEFVSAGGMEMYRKYYNKSFVDSYNEPSNNYPAHLLLQPI